MPSSLTVPQPAGQEDRARAKLAEVRDHLDCLNLAILSKLELHMTAWGARWMTYWAEVLDWERQSREDLDDWGTNALDARRIIDEGNAHLRTLRRWHHEAEAQGGKVPCPLPPDVIATPGVGDVPRWTFYVAGGAVVVGLGYLASREVRSWAELLGVGSSSRGRR